jgi:hypothetical protein
MQLCYRDLKDDDSHLQDKGWLRSPARKLWHVIVEFVSACSARKGVLDPTGANIFDVESLVCIHAQRYVVHHAVPSCPDDMVLAMASKAGRQKAVAGIYYKVKRNIGMSTADATSHVAAGRATIIPADPYRVYFPHATALKKLDGKDRFFGVFTAKGSINFCSILVGRCMLKKMHDLFHEQAIWPTYHQKKFAEHVMKVDITPGVPLCCFFDSFEKLHEAIKGSGKKYFGPSSSVFIIRPHVDPESPMSQNAAPVIRAVGSAEFTRNYYAAMLDWSKNKKSKKPDPLPFDMVETVTWGDPPQPVASFSEVRPHSTSGAEIFKHCVSQALLGYVSGPFVQHLYVLRSTWQKNRVTVTRIISAPDFNGNVPTGDESANCSIAKSWSTKTDTKTMCRGNTVLILAKK